MAAQQQPQQAMERTGKKDALATLSFTIEQKKASFAEVATKYLSPDRLTKLAQVALSKVPDLAQCTTLSVVDALMTCSRLGLEPHVPGGVWLVPFKDGDRKLCTPIIDYRGLIDVARRSGAVHAVVSDVWCERDLFEHWVDTESRSLVHLRHVRAPGEIATEENPEGERGRVVGAYFAARLSSGQCQAESLTEKQILAYKARSRASKSSYSPWNGPDYLAMYCKTACRRGTNLLPRTPELQALREELMREEALDLGLDRNEGARRRVRSIAASADAKGMVPDDVPFETAEEQREREAREAAAQGEAGEHGGEG